MKDLYPAYLDLLDELRTNLEKLSALAREKDTAVRRDDLMGLDHVLKQEQAVSLALRGLEQKRFKLLVQMGLEKVPLAELPSRYPAELKTKAKQTMEALRQQYQIYQSSAEVARNTLECNLHEIEKVVRDLGGGEGGGVGYEPPGVEIPRPMKTDFRA